MERLTLALVPFDTPLPVALAGILPGTRAIVVIGPDGPLLVTAGDIMAQLNAAIDLGEDTDGVPVGRVVPCHVPTQADPVPPVSPELTYDERAHFDRAFSEDDRRYAIQQVGDDTAIIVTASERYAADLGSSVTVCRCEGEPVHYFEPRQLRVPGRCNKPHGVPVRCDEVEES